MHASLPNSFTAAVLKSTEDLYCFIQLSVSLNLGKSLKVSLKPLVHFCVQLSNQKFDALRHFSLQIPIFKADHFMLQIWLKGVSTLSWI